MLDIFDFTLSSLYVPFRYHFVLSYNLYHISYMTKEKLKTSNSFTIRGTFMSTHKSPKKITNNFADRLKLMLSVENKESETTLD